MSLLKKAIVLIILLLVGQGARAQAPLPSQCELDQKPESRSIGHLWSPFVWQVRILYLFFLYRRLAELEALDLPDPDSIREPKLRDEVFVRAMTTSATDLDDNDKQWLSTFLNRVGFIYWSVPNSDYRHAEMAGLGYRGAGDITHGPGEWLGDALASLGRIASEHESVDWLLTMLTIMPSAEGVWIQGTEDLAALAKHADEQWRSEGTRAWFIAATMAAVRSGQTFDPAMRAILDGEIAELDAKIRDCTIEEDEGNLLGLYLYVKLGRPGLPELERVAEIAQVAQDARVRTAIEGTYWSILTSAFQSAVTEVGRTPDAAHAISAYRRLVVSQFPCGDLTILCELALLTSQTVEEVVGATAGSFEGISPPPGREHFEFPLVAVHLLEALPTATLADALLRSDQPDTTLGPLLRVAWTRAFALSDWALLDKMTPRLRSAYPAYAPFLDRVTQATSPKWKERWAAHLLLSFEGFNVSFERFSWASRKYWCALDTHNVGIRANDWLIEFWTWRNLRVLEAPFTPATFFKLADHQELTALSRIPPGAKRLTEIALDWARETTWLERKLGWDGPVAEMLHLAVQATKVGCSMIEGHSRYSRQAFVTLHRLYPGSTWAKRTKYWYDCERMHGPGYCWTAISPRAEKEGWPAEIGPLAWPPSSP